MRKEKLQDEPRRDRHNNNHSKERRSSRRNQRTQLKNRARDIDRQRQK